MPLPRAQPIRRELGLGLGLGLGLRLHLHLDTGMDMDMDMDLGLVPTLALRLEEAAPARRPRRQPRMPLLLLLVA